ncbi:DnaT-like ssDNA-binding domain-containing protein, partial [Wenyingzhuangia sp. 1_MG-2023]|nr:DnaT-like ssDNA-binding domain-containing protein [Wenyingzhuangia sp. 1_MG-2023]
RGAEFVLSWRDSRQVHNSWNSRFLQYIKQQWARQLSQPTPSTTSGGKNGQAAAEPDYTTVEASLRRLNDTSW